MTWYAIRTLPGAQVPQREYVVEKTAGEDGKSRGKGYRIAPSLNPHKSAVELALEDAGFTYYMPAEFAVVRNRHKKGLYETRRFPLLRGYVFVCEMQDGDWFRLLGTPEHPGVPGIRGVVANNGRPFPISGMEMFKLRMYEAESRALAEQKARYMSGGEERLAREKRKIAARNARRKLHIGKEAKLIWGKHAGSTVKVKAWPEQDTVSVILQSLDAVSETITVPYEYLKVAS